MSDPIPPVLVTNHNVKHIVYLELGKEGVEDDYITDPSFPLPKGVYVGKGGAILFNRLLFPGYPHAHNIRIEYRLAAGSPFTIRSFRFEQTAGNSDPDGVDTFTRRQTLDKKFSFRNTLRDEGTWKLHFTVTENGDEYTIDPEVSNADILSDVHKPSP